MADTITPDDVATLKQFLENLRVLMPLAEKAARLSGIEAQVAALDAQIVTLQGQVGRLRAEAEQHQGYLRDSRAAMSQMQGQQGQLTTDINAKRAILKDLEVREQRLRDEIEASKQELNPQRIGPSMTRP